jgi:hypothetical protein
LRAGTNTRRTRRVLRTLFGGTVGKDTASKRKSFKFGTSLSLYES